MKPHETAKSDRLVQVPVPPALAGLGAVASAAVSVASALVLGMVFISKVRSGQRRAYVVMAVSLAIAVQSGVIAVRFARAARPTS